MIHGFRPEVEASPPLVRVPPPDLHRHLAGLLESKKDADVVFDVAGETFSAHRCVLAARSSVFSAELFCPIKEGGGGGLASTYMTWSHMCSTLCWHSCTPTHCRR